MPYSSICSYCDALVWSCATLTVCLAMEGDGEPKNIWVFASDGDRAGVESCLAQGNTPNDLDEHGYTPM